MGGAELEREMAKTKKTPQELADDMAIAAGETCPDCGCRETESNGHGEYRCCECDHRWGIDFGMRYGY
jgi:tRNA(Ile2) C34 agmatinyltransferase TiaS